MASQDIKSAVKVFAVLDVLLCNFAHGFSPKELIEATGFSGTDITRYVSTLIQVGYAERIQETGRIRPSERLARHAVQILNSLNAAEKQLADLNQRINRI
jgi:DNA-binding IclR family transcriptional regulator